jgi:hypothetical protein
MSRKKTDPSNNLVVVSDLHCGCRMGLCPPRGASLDDGGDYKPSKLQKAIWSHWDEFWGEFVPVATHGEPFTVVINGDAIDGVHHRSTTQVSHNLFDQKKIAYEVLKPVVEACDGRFYMIRGTAAHVGESGVQEEELAKALGAIPNDEGQYSRYELWKRVGKGLVHALHHVGTTGSSHYESSAVHAEMIAEFVESARWDGQPPNIVVRSHRHRYLKTEFATARGFGMSVVTPGWQGRTPFTFKIPGARLAPPQFGGLVIRQGDRHLYVEPRVWTPARSKEE